MVVHNLMEELVVNIVDEIFDNKKYLGRTGCPDTKQCRIDVTCYVLNRIPPKYTTSGRGLAHIEKSIVDHPQINADITALVNEGIKQVSTHMRPGDFDDDNVLPEPPMFNFPIIKGKVFNGKTFAPHTGSSISLNDDSGLVRMRGESWNNPAALVQETDGSFHFWPAPVKASEPGEKRLFSFSIGIDAEGFKPIRHFISLDLTAEDRFVNSMEINSIYQVESIYLFGENDPEEIEP